MAESDLIERLEQAVNRRPFVPFDLQLPDGTHVTVDAPQTIAFRAGVIVYLGQNRTCTLFDREEMRQVALPPGQLPASRSVTAGLLAAFLVGICGAVIAATVQIESIVGTGPAFSAFGLLVAERGRRRGVRPMFWLGISTLMLSLFVFALINLAGLGPDAAHHPVSVLAMVYQSVVVPAGLLTLWRLYAAGPQDPRAAWQFNLRSLLGLMCLVGISLAAARIAHNQGLTTLTATAIALATASLCGLGVLWWSIQNGGVTEVKDGRFESVAAPAPAREKRATP